VKNSFERVSVCATARTTYVSQQQHTHTQVRRSIEVAALKLLLIWLVVEFRWFRDAALTQDASNVRHHGVSSASGLTIPIRQETAT
jgi:hypothetical protein